MYRDDSLSASPAFHSCSRIYWIVTIYPLFLDCIFMDDPPALRLQSPDSWPPPPPPHVLIRWPEQGDGWTGMSGLRVTGSVRDKRMILKQIVLTRLLRHHFVCPLRAADRTGGMRRAIIIYLEPTSNWWHLLLDFRKACDSFLMDVLWIRIKRPDDGRRLDSYWLYSMYILYMQCTTRRPCID